MLRLLDGDRMVDRMDVDAAVVELYGLPPELFTAARNELARSTRDVDPQLGDAIQTLKKPTLAAWLANQLIRAAPDHIHDLTELGEELRQAQISGDGARLRQLTPRRHQLVQQLVKTARTLAREQGRPVSQQIAERLTETLDAAVVDPGAAQLLRSGQLTSALRHVGFGVVDETGGFAQLAPIKPRVVRSTRPKSPARKAARRPPQPPKVDRTPQKRRAELETRAREAESDYAAAEAERAEAEAQLSAHEHHLADLEASIERLAEELEQARQDLREANRRTRRLQVELARTTRNVSIAARRRDANQQRLANLDSLATSSAGDKDG